MDRRERWRVGVVAGVVSVALAAAAACGGPSGPDPADSDPGLTTAEQWFANFYSAQRQGVINLRPFLDPDVVLDHRGLTRGEVVVGQDAVLAYLGTQWSPALRVRTPAAPVYLSRVGVVELALVTPTNSNAFHGVFIEQFGARGITSEQYAGSELSWGRSQADDVRRSEMHELAGEYIAAWSSADGNAVQDLYAPDATATDDLATVQAAGMTQIGTLAQADVAAGGLPGVTLDSLPDFAGPADFAAGQPTWRDDPPPLETQILLVTVDNGGGCPGHLAIVLDLDADGRITGERRHHRVDDLVRCAGGVLQAGWWDEVTVPPAVTIELTGTLDVAGHEVQVFNGTEGLDGLVEWAFGRFTAAGLPTPVVNSVTFLEGRTDKCDELVGLIADREVTLCFQTAICVGDLCDRWTDAARTTTLHELAHAWIDDHVSTDTRKAFLELAGLESWASADVAWGDRGVELAASTMAWGLLDVESSVNPKLGARTCAELTELFRLLVGGRAQPYPTCPPAP